MPSTGLRTNGAPNHIDWNDCTNSCVLHDGMVDRDRLKFMKTRIMRPVEIKIALSSADGIPTHRHDIGPPRLQFSNKHFGVSNEDAGVPVAFATAYERRSGVGWRFLDKPLNLKALRCPSNGPACRDVSVSCGRVGRLDPEGYDATFSCNGGGSGHCAMELLAVANNMIGGHDGEGRRVSVLHALERGQGDGASGSARGGLEDKCRRLDADLAELLCG